MKTSLRCAAFALLVVWCAGCGGSEPPPPPAPPAAQPDAHFKHEQAGVQFEVPSGWRTRTDVDRMTFVSPDGTMTVVLFTAADENMAAVADAVDRQIGSIVAKPVVEGGLENGTTNGIPVMTQKGTGEVDGRKIEWTVRLYEAKQHVLVLAFGAAGAFDRYYPELDRFQSSFKPV